MNLKNFSSGMNARLAFSTAIATEPDILLLDEVLAVGDIEFQRKCMDEINNVNKSGTVRDLCERAMFLDNGEVVAIGAAEEVVKTYLNSVAE